MELKSCWGLGQEETPKGRLDVLTDGGRLQNCWNPGFLKASIPVKLRWVSFGNFCNMKLIAKTDIWLQYERWSRSIVAHLGVRA